MAVVDPHYLWALGHFIMLFGAGTSSSPDLSHYHLLYLSFILTIRILSRVASLTLDSQRPPPNPLLPPDPFPHLQSMLHRHPTLVLDRRIQVPGKTGVESGLFEEGVCR